MSFLNSLRAAAVAVIAALSFSSAFAAEEHYLKDGVGLSGYDPVAYFTVGQPTVGDAAHSAEYDGVTYHFASADNQATFEADPAKYAPAYGGYCAFGTAMGRKFPGDPQQWSIVDDKLYVNLNAKIKERWSADIPGFIKGADNNWALIESVSDAELEAGNGPDGLTQGAL